MLFSAFHVSIYAKDTEAALGASTRLFTRSFEEVVDLLVKLPRMFVEPDGSFVWVSPHEPAWQVDGVIYDRAGRLWYAEIKGRCPEEQFDQFLSALGWPQTPVVVQLMQEAVQLGEDEFRRRVGWRHPQGGSA
jgi:hypothetical protein